MHIVAASQGGEIDFCQTGTGWKNALRHAVSHTVAIMKGLTIINLPSVIAAHSSGRAELKRKQGTGGIAMANIRAGHP
jgi:hypothetical protein